MSEIIYIYIQFFSIIIFIVLKQYRILFYSKIIEIITIILKILIYLIIFCPLGFNLQTYK